MQDEYHQGSSDQHRISIIVSTSRKEHDMVDICPICQKLLRGYVMKLVRCSHRLCASCLTKWTKKANYGRRSQKGHCLVCRSFHIIGNGVKWFGSYINKTAPPNETRKQRHQRLRVWSVMKNASGVDWRRLSTRRITPWMMRHAMGMRQSKTRTVTWLKLSTLTVNNLGSSIPRATCAKLRGCKEAKGVLNHLKFLIHCWNMVPNRMWRAGMDWVSGRRHRGYENDRSCI